MNERDEFIVEAETGERVTCGELTGWETVTFEVADDEGESE